MGAPTETSGLLNLMALHPFTRGSFLQLTGYEMSFPLHPDKRSDLLFLVHLKTLILLFMAAFGKYTYIFL